MKPAISVLIFTVSSGAGYGLLLWMLILQIFTSERVDLNQLLMIGLIGLSLVTLGLLASTLHLANPKNAWRAFNRFRTSWLSREGVFAILFYPLFLSYAGSLWLNQGVQTNLSMLAAIASIFIAVCTVISTGMIYASLKPIRQWHNPWTTPLYLIFSLLSGALLYLTIDFSQNGAFSTDVLICFFVLLVCAAIAKLCYFSSIGKPEGLTINDATGFSQASVRLLDAGHNAATFLTREFVFEVDARRLLNLRWLMAVLIFALPGCLMAIAIYSSSPALSVPALTVQLIGLLLERWLFFAEARHVVRLYHGDQRA